MQQVVVAVLFVVVGLGVSYSMFFEMVISLLNAVDVWIFGGENFMYDFPAFDVSSDGDS